MTTPLYLCTWCGGAAEDEQALRDHQAWCLRDAVANTRLLDDVAQREGELSQEALVAEARRRRRERASGGRPPSRPPA